jgi:4-carboxymuconolactone decarboxylase
MATLPDPTGSLTGADRRQYDHMAARRAHAEGRKSLGEVYVRMFNNPGVATSVGALGEQLRFRGVLPDDARELTILRYASRMGFWYEWAHHQRPAQLAGLRPDFLDAITRGGMPPDLAEPLRATLLAVDAVAAHESIPADLQDVIVGAYGSAGAVEIVALCGMYALMGYTVTAFDIPIEDGLPQPPDQV